MYSAIAISPSIMGAFMINDLKPSPMHTAVIGSSVGLSTAIISHFLNTPSFPETELEYRYIKRSLYWNSFKSIVGFGTCFLIYQGLVTGVSKGFTPSEKWDDHSNWKWNFTNFLAGGTAGLGFRVATASLYRGLEANPLIRKPILIANTFLTMGTLFALCAGVSSILKV
jgi:hypothetical protein